MGYDLGPYVAEMRLAERVVLIGTFIGIGGYVGRWVWGRRRPDRRRPLA